MSKDVWLQDKEHHHGTVFTKTATHAIPEVFLYISFVKNIFTCDLEGEHTK
jgi:hypothetical protein